MSYRTDIFKTMEDQLSMAQAIFEGKKEDLDGYCACPECGSRKITDYVSALDDVTISCDRCSFTVSTNSYLTALVTWNFLDRNSFQLKIIFE